MFTEGGSVLSYRDIVERWCENDEFREYFTATLRSVSFEAFCWETPPVVQRTYEFPFEFVLVQEPALERVVADPAPFQSYFDSRTTEQVLTFPNLGGDALLVVPAPLTVARCYSHLAEFLRHGPSGQVSAFWRVAGLAMRKRVSGMPVWLSTAGLGVSWLHLRLDSRPKYYRHEAYRAAP
jgi:hypothetical protein